MLGGRLFFLHNHIGTLFRFGIVGGTTYILTVAVFYLLNNILNMPNGLSATVAYFIGVTYHFAMNRTFTFANKQNAIMGQLAKYALLTVANYLLTLAQFEILLHFVRQMPALLFALSAATTTLAGYVVMRYWIFPVKLNKETNAFQTIHGSTGLPQCGPRN